MSDYTPTTEEVRDYIQAADRVTAHMFSGSSDSVEAFDRWLAAHDAEVRAEEWDAGYEAGAEDQADCEGHRYYRDNTPGFDHWRTNPHRKAER